MNNKLNFFLQSFNSIFKGVIIALIIVGSTTFGVIQGSILAMGKTTTEVVIHNIYLYTFVLFAIVIVFGFAKTTIQMYIQKKKEDKTKTNVTEGVV